MFKRRNIKRNGFTIVEIVVSMAILLAGIVAIINLFPWSLKAMNDAAVLTEASLLAQWKAEEIRRDNVITASETDYIDYIKTLTAPEPTDGIAFEENDHLTYSFCGVSLLDSVDDPADPRDDRGVARIIVRHNKNIDPKMKVIYELEFDD